MTDDSIRGRDRYLWAFLLSCLTPGCGQIYAGKWRRGIIMVGCYVASGPVIRGLSRFSGSTADWKFLFLPAFVALIVGCLAAAIDSLLQVRTATVRLHRPWYRSISIIVVLVGMIGVASSAVIPFGLRGFSVPSGSNVPTLLPGDVFMASTTKASRVPHRGDMVVFRYPRNQAVLYIKRVVGLPGDHVSLSAGILQLNGKPVPRDPRGSYETTDESGYKVLLQQYEETLPDGAHYTIVKYSDAPRSGASGTIDPNNTPEYSVPADSVFVLGDNRDNSSDSRFMNGVGYVPIRNLVGKALFLYFSWEAVFSHDGVTVPGHVRWYRLFKTVQ